METIKRQLGELKLSGMAKSLEVRNEYAISERLSFIDFLSLLLEDEFSNRRDNGYRKRLSKAHFPARKTLEEFDFKFQPQLNKRLIFDCATCEYIRKRENLVFIGPPGVGNYRKFLFMERKKNICLFYTKCIFISFHNTSQ